MPSAPVDSRKGRPLCNGLPEGEELAARGLVDAAAALSAVPSAWSEMAWSCGLARPLLDSSMCNWLPMIMKVGAHSPMKMPKRSACAWSFRDYSLVAMG